MTETRALPEPVEIMPAPIRLEYSYQPGSAVTEFLDGMMEGRIQGRRCPGCSKVYVPPRPCCPMCGDLMSEIVEVGKEGTLCTYAIVNVPFASRTVELPYCTAEVLLDGSDTTTSYLLQGIPVSQVRIGMRVRTVWKDPEDFEFSFGNIEHVEPTGEPDVDFELIKEYV